MAGFHKDKRTGIYVVQFYDPARTSKRKQATTGSRELRVARRLHRRWEGAYAEGKGAARGVVFGDVLRAPGRCARRAPRRGGAL